MKRLGVVLALLVVAVALTAGTASADYGQGAVYQVEIRPTRQRGRFGSGPSSTQAERVVTTKRRIASISAGAARMGLGTPRAASQVGLWAAGC